jgi:pimeloyl-ACP methyl ester carboxylesterase
MYENIIKIVLVVLVIITITVLLVKRFIYFQPSTEFMQYNNTYKDISEGNLHGWFVGKKENTPTILICHGNGGNISHRQSLIDSMTDIGYSVMIFDYSGYGRSRGIPSQSQFYHDASVFTEMLMEFVDKQNIILYGESIGAAVAAYIARKYKINTLIIDSGLPSIKKYIRGHYSFLGSLLGFLFPEFNTELYLKGYSGRSLIMHSPTDEIIPYIITDVMRANATEVINIQGTHNNRKIPWDKVDTFIKNQTKSLSL